MLRTWRAVCLLAAVLAAAPAMAAGYRIEAQAQPQRLAAGAAEPCGITVRVTDLSGVPVPDGTQVTFISTLGTLTPEVAITASGLARVELTSATPGTAEVSVLVAGQRQTVVVEFRAPAATAPTPAGAPGAEAGKPTAPKHEVKLADIIKISGKYVAYSADRDCVTAADQARAQHGALAIEAGNIQYEIARGILKAQHDVRIRRGTTTIEGERACYYVATGQGVVLRAREGVERVAFCADELQPQNDPVAAAADFAPIDASDTSTWIVAREATVIPRERIQFTNARLYVGDRRLFSLPHYVAQLRGQRSLLNQVFSFSSSGGINLELPLYYAANDSHAGSLQVRHRAAGTYGFGSTGWSLGIEERYRLSPGSTGTLAIDNVTQSTRSVRLDHALDMGANGRVNMGLNYYRYNPNYPGALTGRAFFSRRLNGADLDVIALASAVGGFNTWSLDSNVRWGGRQIGRSGILYDVTTNMGYGGGQLGYGGGLSLGSGLGVSPPAWRISKSTSGSLDLAQQYVWAQIGGVSTTFDARAALRQTLRNLGSMTLSYDYSLSQGGYLSSLGRQQLSANAYLNQGLKWNASGYASYSLDRDSIFASGGASYRLPFQARSGPSPWRLDLRGNYTRFSGARSVSSRLAIARAIGQYEVLLCYSPTGSYGFGSYGYGYGFSTGKKIWLELSALSF